MNTEQTELVQTTITQVKRKLKAKGVKLSKKNESDGFAYYAGGNGHREKAEHQVWLTFELGGSWIALGSGATSPGRVRAKLFRGFQYLPTTRSDPMRSFQPKGQKHGWSFNVDSVVKAFIKLVRQADQAFQQWLGDVIEEKKSAAVLHDTLRRLGPKHGKREGDSYRFQGIEDIHHWGDEGFSVKLYSVDRLCVRKLEQLILIMKVMHRHEEED